MQEVARVEVGKGVGLGLGGGVGLGRGGRRTCGGRSRAGRRRPSPSARGATVCVCVCVCDLERRGNVRLVRVAGVLDEARLGYGATRIRHDSDKAPPHAGGHARRLASRPHARVALLRDLNMAKGQARACPLEGHGHHVFNERRAAQG